MFGSKLKMKTHTLCVLVVLGIDFAINVETGSIRLNLHITRPTRFYIWSFSDDSLNLTILFWISFTLHCVPFTEKILTSRNDSTHSMMNLISVPEMSLNVAWHGAIHILAFYSEWKFPSFQTDLHQRSTINLLSVINWDEDREQKVQPFLGFEHTSNKFPR